MLGQATSSTVDNHRPRAVKVKRGVVSTRAARRILILHTIRFQDLSTLDESAPQIVRYVQPATHRIQNGLERYFERRVWRRGSRAGAGEGARWRTGWWPKQVPPEISLYDGGGGRPVGARGVRTHPIRDSATCHLHTWRRSSLGHNEDGTQRERSDPSSYSLLLPMPLSRVVPMGRLSSGPTGSKLHHNSVFDGVREAPDGSEAGGSTLPSGRFGEDEG
ncbi:hypothetical protein BJV78DRAFT_722807 [Lactifluus subvellereus]|nr:hypothetical protein BJV78DRAFT_722807 [Lactifluus subvellereus]